ncbi:response regulator [Cyanobacteria bacterium FACHB-63]|nr:response regulator [Cyanobacteria bacterium FACHB-63]
MTRSQTLLLIEDFAPDRELYRRFLLGDSGCVYHLLEADSIEAGLEVCRTEAIDAILLDYLLPDGDGLEFLQALRAQSNGEFPPVIMVTGEGNEQIAVQALKLGAEDYLVKRHLTPELVQRTMRNAIENAQLRLQLQQSRDRFRVSIETTLDCLGICSAMRDQSGQIIDFRIEYLNAAAMSDTQLTSADLGKGLCEVFPAHRETGMFEAYCEVIEAGKPLLRESLIYSDEFGGQHLSRAYDIRANKLDDGFVVSWRDVTSQRQAELRQQELIRQLQESERRFREIFNTTFQFVGLLSPDGILLEANQTALDFAGLTFEEAVGRPFWEIRWWTLSPETQQQLQAAISQARQGEFVRYEVEVLGAGTTTKTIDFSLKPVQNETGEVVLLIPEGRDISDRIRYERDRKYREQCLRESEEQVQLGVQVSGVALARFDYTTDTVTLSPEAAALYGLEELTVSRDRLHATFHPDDRAELDQIVHQVLDPAGLGWFAYDHRVVWPAGEVRWLSVRKQVFFNRSDPSRRPDYGILAAIDITERKQAEQERHQLLIEAEAAREQAELANRSKDDFVAMVAHELRSPLNSISGWAQLLQTRKLDPAIASKALDTIWRNTQAQVQLVEDLLDISRMVRGTLQIQTTPVNWAEVSEAAIDLVRPMAAAKSIDLELHLASVPPVSGDFNRLQQIAVNLLTNAIKFTPASGRVEIQLEQAGNQAVLSVRDTGKGIAPEFLPQIFERYQQGQKSVGSKDGLGLGLAIVKHLVELHHGTIAAESEGEGGGATFTVRLPLLTSLIDSPSLLEAPVAISLAGTRILIVDDESDQIDLMTFMLENYDADVKSATNAAAALECLSRFEPDVLISDIGMPDCSGYELLQQVRSMPAGQIPAIALTAFTDATYQERSRQAGFQRHLTKPIEPELLAMTILSVIEQPS